LIVSKTISLGVAEVNTVAMVSVPNNSKIVGQCHLDSHTPLTKDSIILRVSFVVSRILSPWLRAVLSALGYVLFQAKRYTFNRH
jgi:hypothetical protein